MKNLTYSLLILFLVFISCEDEEVSCLDCTEKDGFFGSLDGFDIPSSIYDKVDVEQDDWFYDWFGSSHPEMVVARLHDLRENIKYYRDSIFNITEAHRAIERPDLAIEVGGNGFRSSFYSLIDNNGIGHIIEIGEDEEYNYFNQYNFCTSGLLKCVDVWVITFQAKQSKTNFRGEVIKYTNGTRKSQLWNWEIEGNDQLLFATEYNAILGWDSAELIKINPDGSGSITVIDEGCSSHHLELPNCIDNSEMLWSWNAQGVGLFEWEAADETKSW